jgi:hypothetical protein
VPTEAAAKTVAFPLFAVAVLDVPLGTGPVGTAAESMTTKADGAAGPAAAGAVTPGCAPAAAVGAGFAATWDVVASDVCGPVGWTAATVAVPVLSTPVAVTATVGTAPLTVWGVVARTAATAAVTG